MKPFAPVYGPEIAISLFGVPSEANLLRAKTGQRQYVRCNGQTRILATGVICSCFKVHNASYPDTERQVPTRSG
jgi:hypothetical protein